MFCCWEPGFFHASSHPLTFSCIHFHLSPIDQSDFSWALMPLSTTLLLGGHPGPWLPSIQPCGQPQSSRLQGKCLSYLPFHRGWRRIRRLEGGMLTYRHTPFPLSVYLINSSLGARAKKAAENGLTLPEHSRHVSRAKSKCIS